ncbi:unnamed protein product [Gongylonema pulchrum]|uniref:Protein kinase domain-containing protein n=1 Tax=Gongylonema pulchrum TaxID=637853 RepID=A0A183DUU4_9BILA|nr:unnamed protein product [Gongylonema pulchrum]
MRKLSIFESFLKLIGTGGHDAADDSQCWSDCGANGEVQDRRAPGPTSCVFLEMALKRLYAKEDFDVLECLGEGFFGDVYKVRHRVTEEVMVLKVGKERQRENRAQVKADVLKEVDVLNKLTSHPNLLAFR